nr:MAG TPA: ParB protein [Caudoviricetes sp.]
MKTEEIALSRVSENEANPRTITEANFQKLVKSILVFPKMLQLRPIVVDETYKALGGNMRTRALCHIVSMTPEAIMDVLDTDQRMTDAEKLAIANYWSQWKEQPTATIVKASDLTEGQKKEFIIKDNAGFGDWDTNALANQWNTDLLKDWGVESFNNYDISGFFDEDDKSIGNEEKTAQNENLSKITIEIPSEMDDSKQEIIDSVRELLKDYEGVKVYE